MAVLRRFVELDDDGDYRCEYTVDCGWIDWAHATPDRDDIKTIWTALYPQNGKYKPDVRIRDRSTGEEHTYWEVEVKFLEGTEEWRSSETWYVRNVGYDLTYYKKCALSLYEYSCEWVEENQSSGSSWHMEDLVSNLAAFHMHVDHYWSEKAKRKFIAEKCGGWANTRTAQFNSLQIYEILDAGEVTMGDASSKSGAVWPEFDQPSAEGKGFRQAYLYNKNVSQLTRGDRRDGWTALPDYFWDLLPLPKLDEVFNGADILSAFAIAELKRTHDVKTAANYLHQSHQINQQLARTVPTKRGNGRLPGPLGREPFA